MERQRKVVTPDVMLCILAARTFQIQFLGAGDARWTPSLACQTKKAMSLGQVCVVIHGSPAATLQKERKIDSVRAELLELRDHSSQCRSTHQHLQRASWTGGELEAAAQQTPLARTCGCQQLSIGHVWSWRVWRRESGVFSSKGPRLGCGDEHETFSQDTHACPAGDTFSLWQQAKKIDF